MELDLAFFAVAIPAVLIAAVSKGGFGSGAGFASAPLLALVLEPRLAVALLLPLLMLMDVTGIRPYWRLWSPVHARALMIGAVPGVLAGTALFGFVSADALRLVMGVLAIGFVLWQLARVRGLIEPPPMPPSAGIFWGALAGFTSFVNHAGAPPAFVYLLGSRLDKLAFQATTMLAFWWINLLKFPGYAVLGLFTTETVFANLLLAPLAIGGVYLGVWLHRRVSATVFFGLTYVLMTLTGAKLIWDALG